MPAKITNPVQHVWRRLAFVGGCWEWTGSRNPHGYGQIRLGNRLRYLHRLLYEWTRGVIPAGQVVMHACDNPACCNPAHLSLGTQADNLRDMVAKGRHRSGAANQRKTHCRLGHEYNDANTYRTKHGHRGCRACHAMHEAARKARLRDATTETRTAA